MNNTRSVVLMSLLKLIEEPDIVKAQRLLNDWSLHVVEPIMKAACSYMIHFVIPSLKGADCTDKRLSTWIDRLLFHPLPEVINTRSEWLSLFPGTSCESLYERVEGYCVRHGVDTADSLIDELKTQNRGLYFSPNGHSLNRNSANIDRLNACFADFDHRSKEEQMVFIKSLSLKPSIVVESGNGYHVYWMFTQIETNKELWIRIQKKISAVCGSDPKVCNPDRLMRMPFSWHTKTDNKQFVKVVYYSTRRYSLADLEVAFPPDTVKVFNLPKDYVRTLKIPDVLSLGKGSRHGTLMEETARIYARLPGEKALEARQGLKIWYQASCSPLKSFWEKEVDDSCDWAEKKEYGSVISH